MVWSFNLRSLNYTKEMMWYGIKVTISRFGTKLNNYRNRKLKLIIFCNTIYFFVLFSYSRSYSQRGEKTAIHVQPINNSKLKEFIRRCKNIFSHWFGCIGLWCINVLNGVSTVSFLSWRVLATNLSLDFKEEGGRRIQLIQMR